MAKKSKTQRAKASAARAARKAARDEAALNEAAAETSAPEEEEKSSRTLFKKKDEDAEAKADEKKAVAKKEEPKTKKRNRVSQFFHDVRLEMKRVTWPSRQDVLRWSGVVVVALLFFGIYVAVLDNAIITPILVGISGIGPAIGIS